MLGRASNRRFIDSLLVESDDLGFMGGAQPLIKEVALGQQFFARLLACLLQKLADLDGGQPQHQGKVCLGK